MNPINVKQAAKISTEYNINTKPHCYIIFTTHTGMYGILTNSVITQTVQR